MSNIDFNSLSRLSNPNSRINYDLRWSKKTGKFTVADAAFERLNLNDNGFDVFRDANGSIVFMVVPNEDAPLYAGQEGSDKSSTFSATRLVSSLELEETTTFKMNEIEHEGNTYITLEVLDVIEEVEEEAQSVESSEEVNETQEAPENSFSI